MPVDFANRITRVIWLGSRTLILSMVALFVVLPGGSLAGWVAPPARDVTAQDIANFSVSTSDGIVVGCVLATERQRTPVKDVPGAFTEHYEVVIACLDWLKGYSSNQSIRAYYDPTYLNAQSEFRNGVETGAKFIFFLRRHPKLPMGVDLEDAGDNSITWEWSLKQSPHVLGGGAMKIDRDSGSDSIALVRRTLESQQVPSLAQEADAIIIGTPLNWRSASPGSPFRGKCRLYQVLDRATDKVPDIICVHTVFAGTEPKGTSLLSLRRLNANDFEVLASTAGIRSVKGGRIAATGEPVSEVIVDLRNLRSGLDTKGK